MHIAILGAGAWGTGTAISLGARHAVTLWGREEALIAALVAARMNTKYLDGILIPSSVTITTNLMDALEASDLVIVATSVGGLRSILSTLREHHCAAPVLWLCKGFERGTSKLPHAIAEEELPTGLVHGVLSGPSFARDVALGLPAAITLASRDGAFAAGMGKALNSATLRIYSSDDLIGVEVGGAVKNVIAIAAGISDGLGLGESARAALITRGLAELTRLGVNLGGRMETFLGLAGAGDLLLTCTSDQSRNRKVGFALARGGTLGDILGHLGHVAEGVFTAREARDLGKRAGVETPIVDAVCKVIDGELAPRAAVAELMAREPRRDGMR